MWALTFSFWSSPESPLMAVLADWRVWAMAFGECLLWLVLWRSGFRLRTLPDCFLGALARLRGLFRAE